MRPAYFGAADLEELLELDSLRERMREALSLEASCGGTSSPRFVLPLPKGAFGAMLGAGGGAVGGKLVCVLPGNRALGLNPHQGIAALFHPETGRCLCVADAAMLTALRTAAASACATEALSRPESKTLAVVGTGEQAQRHIDAVQRVRPIRELRLAGRNLSAAEDLVRRYSSELETKVCADPQTAARGADILCLCTGAQTPYLSLRELDPGTHVNAVGACRPGAREIDLAEGEARFFVDSLEAARAEAEELRLRSEKGECLIPLGHVLMGQKARSAESDITVFKSVGIGIEDTLALALALERSGGRL